EVEVVNGVQLRRLARLKREGQPRQEPLNRPGPQAVADPLDRLEGEAAGHVVLGVRAGDDIDRLRLLLQGADGFPQVGCLFVERLDRGVIGQLHGSLLLLVYATIRARKKRARILPVASPACWPSCSAAPARLRPK